MIYKWNEISLEMFKDILESFWNHESWTSGKVLEIQNLLAIKEGAPDIRIYFGADIKLKDWEKYNPFTMAMLETFGMSMDVIDKYDKLSVCMLSEKCPRISPLGLPEHFKMIWKDFFGGYPKDWDEEIPETSVSKEAGSPLTLWYTTDDTGKKICDRRKSRTSNTIEEKYVRIRTIDYPDWLKMVTEFVEDPEAELRNCEADIPEYNIIVLRESSELSDREELLRRLLEDEEDGF